MTGYKYAGVTLDWYDDRGETLKSKFPTLDHLPDVIKEAGIRPKDQLANEEFALVMVDEGHVYRKYACADAGTTAMSTIYFMEHGDKLPEAAQKLAATNITASCLQHGMMPPAAIIKLANGDEEMDEGSPPTMEQRAKIRQFVKSNPHLSDDEFHAFSERLGVNPHFAEAEVYSMAHELSKKAAADMIPGGKADKKSSSDFSPKQMAMGQKVEMEHTNDPAKAREIARDHLEEFGDYYTRLDKMESEAEKAKEGAAQCPGGKIRSKGKGRGAGRGKKKGPIGVPILDKKAGIVDITGMNPNPKVKVAAPQSDRDYAVITQDGRRMYPIHTWGMVKKAEAYFHDEQKRMHPEVRRQFAVKLAQKSYAMGYPLSPDIAELGANDYHNPGHMRAAIEMRKISCAPDSDARKDYDDLFEKRAEIHPEVYAEVMRQIDVREGLDRGWDHLVLDPWTSTFGTKTASVVWENESGDRVTDDELINLANNHLDVVTEDFTEGMAKEFKKDPVAIFNSMPDPQKKLLARMAADSASSGEAEHRTA